MINADTAYTIPFVTMAAGVPTNAASTPTAVVWRNGSAEATSVTVSTTSNTGIYHAAFTTGSGWAKTDRIWLVISATISSVAYRGIVWDSFSEPDAVMLTAAAAADAVWDEPYNQHTTAGTFGKLMDILRKSNTVIEGTILASPTPTTTTFRISGADYPTGALEHSVLWMSSGTSAEQNSPILTTVNNGDGTLTITLEEALVTAPIAGDVVLIDPTSHVHAITDIASGIWSAASSSYSAATGTMGLVMYAFSQMLELVTGVWRWKATSLEEAPAGGGGGDASQATLLAVKAKTDLITSQSASQQQTPVNQIAITRGDSYSGATKITRVVTTDYTGYAATFTIRHRITNAVLLTKAATVDSSTQLSVSLTTTDTAFALLVNVTEFGPHPYDFRLVSGSIEKTEPGIAIIKRDVTT
jgi:hypothetical protein